MFYRTRVSILRRLIPDELYGVACWVLVLFMIPISILLVKIWETFP